MTARKTSNVSSRQAQPDPQFVPLVVPRRSHRGLWFALVGVVLFAAMLGAVYVGITWAASDPGSGAGAAPTGPAARTTTTAKAPVAYKRTAPRNAKATAKNKNAGHAKAKATSTVGVQPPLGPSVDLAIPQSGQRYTFPAAHFAARFPYRPQTTTSSTTGQGVRFSFHTVACFESYIGVESLDISRPPSATDRDRLLRSAGRHLAGGGTVLSEARTTYRQRPAWSMEVAAAPGTTLRVLSVLDRTGRVYALMAPSGARFSALTASFEAIA